jgi:hypothetical protein
MAVIKEKQFPLADFFKEEQKYGQKYGIQSKEEFLHFLRIKCQTEPKEPN